MTPEPVARPVVGFRAWTVDPAGLLRPLAREEADTPTRAWAEPGVPARGLCGRTAGRGLCAATLTCGCGLRGAAELPTAPRPGLLHGVVCGWGRVVVHERGFRAEFARPVAFLDQPCPWFERAVDRYELSVLDADELVAYAGWHGDLLAPQPVA